MTAPAIASSGEETRTLRHDERNRLLRALPPDAYEQLIGGMEMITLRMGQVLYEADTPIEHAYFVQRGVVSLVAPVDHGERGWERSVEVGTIGNEGMVGIPLVLDTDREPVRAFVQVPDGAWRISADALRRVLNDVNGLRPLLLRYVQTFLNQVGQGSACNRAHAVQERCARWLLMTHDRVGEDEFPLPQEFLAAMLGVRRAGVTVAAGMLQRAGFIKYARGDITVVDRSGLESASCACYATIRDTYDRLFSQVL
jgi:CRP-like cAMP-binding protein